MNAMTLLPILKAIMKSEANNEGGHNLSFGDGCLNIYSDEYLNNKIAESVDMICYNGKVLWHSYKYAAGKEIVLSDAESDSLKMIKIYGRSSQKNLSGKNLLARDGHLSFATGTMGDNSLQEAKNYVSTIIDCNKYGRSFYFSCDDFKKYNSSAIRTGVSANMPEAGGYIFRTSNVTSNTVITVPEDKNYLYIGEMLNNASEGLPNSMIEVGRTRTDYEPYCGARLSPNADYPQDIESMKNVVVDVINSDTNTSMFKIASPYECDGLGNTYDEVTVLGEQVNKVCNTYRAVFDGSDDEKIYFTTIENVQYASLTLPHKGKHQYSTDFLCNRFIKNNTGLSSYTVCINEFNEFVIGEDALGFKLTTVSEFRAWLSEHPIEILYELYSPLTEKLNSADMDKTLSEYKVTNKNIRIVNDRDTLMKILYKPKPTDVSNTETSYDVVTLSVDDNECLEIGGNV